jgi:hypothetical protein
MRRYLAILLSTPFIVFLASCGSDRITAPGGESANVAEAHRLVDVDLVAGQMALRAGWPAEDEAGQSVTIESEAAPDKCLDFTREVVSGDVVHYSMQLRVGPTEYDVIGIHRVVREPRPYCPIRTRNAVFLEHGGGKDFVGNFLPGLASPRLPDNLGAAFYLAQHDVDVWGIDHGYVLVPTGVTDFSFMAGWDLQRHVDELSTAIEIARLVRVLGGNGFKQVILSGYSAGGNISYALLNAETQLPRGRRQINAFIPVDYGIATDVDYVQAGFCDQLAANEALLADGIYGLPDETIIFGILARDDPDGESLAFPGFTNLQVLLYFTTMSTPPSTAHYWAGTFDDSGMVTGLQYTSVEMLEDFWIYASYASMPTILGVEASEIFCPGHASPWVAHLGEITVPILQINAAGGYGDQFAHTLELVGSTDVTVHEIRMHAAGEEALDFGHIDLFTAVEAPAVVWQPMLAWIQTHAHR